MWPWEESYGWRPRAVAVAGIHAYVVAGDIETDAGGGLDVINIADPENPQLTGGAGGFYSCPDVAVSGNTVGVLHLWFFSSVPVQCEIVGFENGPETPDPNEEIPTVTLSLAVYPNPFNPQTTITFTLARNERAEIGVYDLTGRLVSVLADRTYTAGDHSVVWNGKDATGRAVPSGSYFVRLETESVVETSKLTLVR